MAESKVNMKVTANVDNAVSEMKKLQEAIGNAGKVGELFGSTVSGGIGQVSGALSGVSSAFSGVAGLASSALGPIALVAAAIGAVVSATKAFITYTTEAVAFTVEWGKETKKLATILSITQLEATALNVAIDDSFVSTETYLGAVNKLTKSIAQHPDIYRQLGISLRDNVTGHYRNANDVMLDTLSKFSKMPESLERNIAMQKVFGKSWQEVLPLLDIADKMKNAREEVEKFGLAMDPKELKRYRVAQDDVKDVFDYMKIALGNNLMPVLTDVMETLGELGKEVLPNVILMFKAFAIMVNEGWTFIQHYCNQLVLMKDLFFGLVKSMGEIDFSKPFETVGKAAENAGKKVLAAIDNFKTNRDYINIESAQREVKILNAGQGGDQKKKGGNPPDVDDDRTQLQRYKDAVEQRKIADMKAAEEKGQILQITAAEELRYLQEELANYQMVGKEKAQADQMILQAKLKVHKDEYDSRVATLDLMQAKLKGDYDGQLVMARTKAAMAAKVYGEESKEALEAARKVIDLENKKLEEFKKVQLLKEDAIRQHAKSQIGLEEQITDHLQKTGAINNEQAIVMRQNLQQRLYDMELKSLQDRLLVNGLEPAEVQKINNDIEALRDQHTQKMLRYNLQLQTEMQKQDGWAGAMQAMQSFIDQSQNQFQMWGTAVTSVLQGAKSAFASFFESIFESGKTGAQKWDALWKAMVKTVIQSIAQLIAQWVVGKIAAEIFGDSVVDAEKSKTVAAMQAAAAETWSAYSGIPFVGPFLAMAQIVLMNASLAANLAAAKASTKAYAVGGLIDKPTFALMGEAGPELVAPEKDFKYWAKNLVFMGSELQSQIAARQMSAMNYQKLADGYSSKAYEAAQNPKPVMTIHQTFNSLDPMLNARAVNDAMTAYQQNFA